MDLQEFQKDAVKTESKVESVNVNLEYLAAILQISICTGNLLDQIKKNVYYGAPIDSEKRAEYVKGIIEAMDTKALFMEDPTADTSILEVNTRLFHAIIGVVTEGTELLENLTDGDLDTVNLLEEMGDINWYQAIAMDELNADWGQMLSKIIAKLKKRYPDQFKSDDAINRDLQSEREILEDIKHELKTESSESNTEKVAD